LFYKPIEEYDAIVVVTEKYASENPDVVEIIKELDGRIDTDSMRELNYQYDVDKKEARCTAGVNC